MAFKRNQHKNTARKHSRNTSLSSRGRKAGYSASYKASYNRARRNRRHHVYKQPSTGRHARHSAAGAVGSSASRVSQTPRTSRVSGTVRASQVTGAGNASASASALDKRVMFFPTSNGEVLLTRRHFLYGAAVLGVLIGVGSGAKACSSAQQQNSALSVLNVAQSQVTESTSLVEVENGGKLSLSAEIELPYGTLMWASNDEVAALLVPTETGSPLTTVSILRLASGYYFSVLEQAVGAAQGFEIYDVRASEQAVVWTEVNILEGVWRIYGALLSDTALSEPVLLDTNTSDWETPSIALCNTTAFWQLMPNAQGAQKASESFVRCARIGQVTGSASSTGSENGASSEGGMSNAGDSASTAASTSSTAAASSSESASGTANISYETVLTSAGRMSTPLYVCDNLVVATPRAQTSGVYYQLSAINATTHEISDALALPQSMTPLEACYGKTGFMFSFEGIYNYGAGISNLGTYAPKIDARGIDYSSAEWFHFARTPSAPPCWCGDFLMVKSTRSVVGVSLDTDTYFVLDSVSGSDTYGDYLASTGNRSRILIFANINDESQSGGSKYCSARIYSAT